ncbi:MAG: N-acetylmuramoyl-L-alanine amidase [Patescibacteria group bacterium]|nr:N-acetylmuramoyl-L-alanine amidase [Patescibacteria group bacterium]
MRYIFGAICACTIFLVPWFMLHPETARIVFQPVQAVGDELASVIFSHDPVTVADLQSDYNSGSLFQAPRKVRILLVPGHEPNYGGAEYGSLKERDMTVQLADDLQAFLSDNPHYQVFVTRDTQSWNPIFADYFQNNWNAIKSWEEAQKNEIQNLTLLGEFHPTGSQVQHIDVPDDVALRIYGIDKWVDENDIDIAIHIHFNDYPGHSPVQPGKYSGFAIYVPEGQYANSQTTKVLADAIEKRLERYNAVSNFPGEIGGIVPDQDLIAVGAYNSVNAPSMLIEYSYIYEPQFTNPNLESTAIKDLAYQTYLGLQDFFDSPDASSTDSFGTLTLPHAWTSPTSSSATMASSSAIYALQSALIADGDYPPAGKSLNTCPRSGKFGPCTEAALQAFQAKYGISGEKGVVGSKTLDRLNKLYGQVIKVI